MTIKLIISIIALVLSLIALGFNIANLCYIKKRHKELRSEYKRLTGEDYKE